MARVSTIETYQVLIPRIKYLFHWIGRRRRCRGPQPPMIALAPDEVAGEIVDGEEAAVPEEVAAGCATGCCA
jgi:hypothetical protein